MVLDIEQIGIGLQNRHGRLVLLYPSSRHEDRRWNTVLHQHVQNAMIGLAHAGIKRQRHLWRCSATPRDMQLRLNDLDRVTRSFVLRSLLRRDIVCTGNASRGENDGSCRSNTTKHDNIF